MIIGIEGDALLWSDPQEVTVSQLLNDLAITNSVEQGVVDADLLGVVAEAAENIGAQNKAIGILTDECRPRFKILEYVVGVHNPGQIDEDVVAVSRENPVEDSD